MQIIKDENLLRRPSEPVSSPEEANEIIKKLEETLKDVGGLGLSAPQIGILKQVAIVRYQYANNDVEKLNIINPTEIELDENKFTFPREGCLSFPGLRFDTQRSQGIEFTNNFGKESHLYHINDDTKPNYGVRIIVAAVQHEMDHLTGKLFFDRKRVNKVKVGRNDPCICGSGKKFKKCCG